MGDTLLRSRPSAAPAGKQAPPSPVKEFIRMPIVVDDLCIVGGKVIRIGPGLREYLRKMLEEGRP